MKNKFTKGLLSALAAAANSVVCAVCASCFLLLYRVSVWFLLPALALFTAVNIKPLSVKPGGMFTARLRCLCHGRDCLTAFVGSCVLSGIYHVFLGIYYIPDRWTVFLFSALLTAFLLSVLFWNGMLSVYATSVQLGIKIRVMGLCCGLIPVLNIVMLVIIIRTVSHEIETEGDKNVINELRKGDKVCSTKYPVMLVHGVFFRDFKALNYWGRIPDELTKNGAVLYYGEHQSASSVADSGAELAERIKSVCDSTGCGKVNIIAHSKGGLDIRWAAAKCGTEPYIASITTINTPHRGCEFADYLLTKISADIQAKVAAAYNTALKRLGDESPDFLKAVRDLTHSRANEINASLEESEEGQESRIFCQSFGSKLNRATNGKFPLNLSYHLVKHFDGPNDGLVSEKSFSWGEKYEFMTVRGKRGISHGDMIDLNRENIPGFDVREFYVDILKNLKEQGL